MINMMYIKWWTQYDHIIVSLSNGYNIKSSPGLILKLYNQTPHFIFNKLWSEIFCDFMFPSDCKYFSRFVYFEFKFNTWTKTQSEFCVCIKTTTTWSEITKGIFSKILSSNILLYQGSFTESVINNKLEEKQILDSSADKLQKFPHLKTTTRGTRGRINSSWCIEHWRRDLKEQYIISSAIFQVKYSFL